MSFKFIHSKWLSCFLTLSEKLNSELLIISPFIQLKAIKKLLTGNKIKIRVITRFNLSNFYENVSDLRAIKYLLDKGAQIKGIKNLHSKVYIFDSRNAIVTSANLTHTALTRNHEYGILTSERDEIEELSNYFSGLWDKGGSILTKQEYNSWVNEIDNIHKFGGKPSKKVQLNDYGKDLGYDEDEDKDNNYHCSVQNAPQYFIKFFGTSEGRYKKSEEIIKGIKDSGCHWACTYPKGKRPRKVEEGAVMFIGRLVEDPDDILVFGRAIGAKYVQERDDATANDIKKRPWKIHWPHYIRIRNPEFLSGPLSNGISMNLLMNKFNFNSFVSTQNNKKKGLGNINPRSAYMQQPAVELTYEAANWLNAELNNKFIKIGRLSDPDLIGLDWPR